MNAQERRMYSEVCERLALALYRMAAAGEADLPFNPLTVAARADATSASLRPVPKLVRNG